MTRIRASRSDYYRQWRQNNRKRVAAYKRDYRAAQSLIIAVDGEGLTRDGVHTYNYLAACNDGKPLAAVESLKGLTTVQCLDTLLHAREAAERVTMVGFSLGYDYTHILKDLPNDKLYRLYRPETRKNDLGVTMPIHWNGYVLNYLRGRLSVARILEHEHAKGCNDDDCTGCLRSKTATLWDIFGFYQASFVNACHAWKVISDDEKTHLESMKAQRSTFTLDQWEDIKRYCHLECDKLEQLFGKLKEAHDKVDLPLRSYFGAGSTATTLLRRMGVKQRMPVYLPAEVEDAAALAFFGGRFECSRVGPIKGKLYSYDIASAYPYQAWRLPCLACGSWKHVKRDVSRALARASFALIRCSVHSDSVNRTLKVAADAWGPLPFRCKGVAGVGPQDSILDDGSITYPATHGGTWTYLDEYRVAAKYWNVKAHEAWIYQTDCDHKPFAELAGMYLERLKLGKEGPGIVMKLGINSVYGKTAQSIGKPIYRCPVWAGAITSGCRAQLLELIGQDPEAVLSVATDGLVSRRKLVLPEPEDTGTHEPAKEYGKVGLGYWETKVISGGMMLIRPGIAFTLQGVDVGNTKGRGIGKATLNRHKQLVLKSWRKHGPKVVELSSVVFKGAKSSISVSMNGEAFKRSQDYGQWIERTTKLSWNPEPKRPYHTQADGRLSTWAFPQSFKSAPYDRMVVSGEAKALAAYEAERMEQPDYGDLDNEL